MTDTQRETVRRPKERTGKQPRTRFVLQSDLDNERHIESRKWPVDDFIEKMKIFSEEEFPSFAALESGVKEVALIRYEQASPENAVERMENYLRNRGFTAAADDVLAWARVYYM